MDFPFEEHIENDYYIRTFSDQVDDLELVWHRDKEDREIEIIENDGWKFQFDGELPFTMNEKFFIPKETYHRVIKGNGDLKIKIKKYE